MERRLEVEGTGLDGHAGVVIHGHGQPKVVVHSEVRIFHGVAEVMVVVRRRPERRQRRPICTADRLCVLRRRVECLGRVVQQQVKRVRWVQTQIRSDDAGRDGVLGVLVCIPGLVCGERRVKVHGRVEEKVKDGNRTTFLQTHVSRIAR